MRLSELLNIPKGITAVIGSGGKTTLMYTIARELSENDRVIVCTTTNILPPEHLETVLGGEIEINSALLRANCVCVGERLPNGKLKCSSVETEKLSELATYVIVEADGSKRLPIKAHESWEPVIPKGTALTVLVTGLSGVGRPIGEAVHRPEVFCRINGCGPNDMVTPERVAGVINSENYHDVVFINQADSEKEMCLARELATELKCPVCAGSLRKEEWKCLR